MLEKHLIIDYKILNIDSIKNFSPKTIRSIFFVAEPASFFAMQVYVPMSEDCVREICRSPAGNTLYRGLNRSIRMPLCSQAIEGVGAPSAEHCSTIGCAWMTLYVSGRVSTSLGNAEIN